MCKNQAPWVINDSKCLLIAYYATGTVLLYLYLLNLHRAVKHGTFISFYWNLIKIIVSKYERLVPIPLPFFLVKRTAILFRVSICQTNFPLFFAAKSNYMTLYNPMKYKQMSVLESSRIVTHFLSLTAFSSLICDYDVQLHFSILTKREMPKESQILALISQSY